MPPHAFDHADMDSHHHRKNLIHSSLLESNDAKEMPLRSSLQSTRSSTAKRVSFGLEESNSVHEVDHINDLEKEEDTTKIWYTDEEYAEIEKHRHETVERRIASLLKLQDLADGKTFSGDDEDDDDEDEEEWCIRGLAMATEKRLSSLYEDFIPVRRSRVQKAVNAVLEEQYQQSTEGVHDDELLAYVYFNYSKKCAMDAAMVGLDDWKEAVLVSDS